MPRHLLFFDTETNMVTKANGDVEHSLKLGWACYWRRGERDRKETEEWFTFTRASQFWEWAFSRVTGKTKLWCIARNVNFDFTVLHGWKHLKKAGYKVKFFYSKGTVCIISVTRADSAIVLLDSMNWFVESLEKTGLRIGLPKMHVDFEKCTLEDLSVYCKNDVRIELENFKIFIAFLTENRISRLCYTQGATAMAAYLFSHYKHQIWIHNNEQAISLERAAYKGGRVEAFKIGTLRKGPYYCVDVNSLYPFVMRNNDYPCKYMRIEHYPTTVELDEYCRSSAVVAKVTLNTKEPVYPFKTERTLFPIGTFDTALCTPELQYALCHGHIVKVHEAILYEKAPLFTSYVDTLYTLRKQFKAKGNDAYVELCKKLMNTLYGKFGQKAEEWQKVADTPDEDDHIETVLDADTGQRTTLRYLLGECFELVAHGESFDSFPAIAAHVTAYGRLWLWHLMQLAGKGNYFYCDTDSLFVNSIGLRYLKSEMSEISLGKLKIVGESKTLVLRGAKDYDFGDKHVVKGLRKNATEIGENVYAQDRWSSIQGLLRTGNSSKYTVTRQTKHLERIYKKGTVLYNGSVLPFVLESDTGTVKAMKAKPQTRTNKTHKA